MPSTGRASSTTSFRRRGRRPGVIRRTSVRDVRPPDGGAEVGQAVHRRGATGTYLRVVTPGQIRAGDRIEVIRRPGHTVTIGRSFRALTTEPELLPSLLEAGDDLPAQDRARILRRIS